MTENQKLGFYKMEAMVLNDFTKSSQSYCKEPG